MCPHANGDAAPNDPAQMVAVDLTNGRPANGVHSQSPAARLEQRRNPYAPRASDFLSNVCNFKIIESTLRGMFQFH